MKLWAMPCRATQDGQFIVESSGKMWSIGGENGKPPQYTYHEKPMNCIKRQKKKKRKEKKNTFLLGCDEAQCNTLYICRKELASRYFYSHGFVENNLSPSEKQIGYLSWTLGKYIFLLTFWPQDWMWRVNVNFFLLLTEKKRFFPLWTEYL